MSSVKGEKQVNSVEYWNGNARWYKLWIDHNNYHGSILETLRFITKPGWNILDIGGGGGVLAIPLMLNQCHVTVLEPSSAMRDILNEEIMKAGGFLTITVDSRRWEDVDPVEFSNHDLILACNSLHLVRPGFREAIKKVFSARTPRIFIVTEQPLNGLQRYGELSDYQLILSEVQEQESSFVYHCLDEAIEHWSFRYGSDPNDIEKQDLFSKLTEKESHFRLKEKAMVYSYYWRHMEADRQ